MAQEPPLQIVIPKLDEDKPVLRRLPPPAPPAASLAEQKRVSNREEDAQNSEPSMSGKQIVGLIIPPPDIRTIVDKTALFVARNGLEFELKIKEREASNMRFNFLNPTDPYFAYYRNKVNEFETGVASAETQSKVKLPEAVREHIQRAEFIPRLPPKPFEFCADPSTLNAFDLDLIHLTALFVARNGRQFLTQLMNREVRNFQFDFLKPQHSNFHYFTKLVEQYTKVLIPSKSVVDDLRAALSQHKILDDVRYRVGWDRHQKALKDREDQAVEKERIAYNQIDWHEFVVVQTVDFQPSETLNLPPLCTPKDVGARILLQQRTEAAKAAAESVAMEVESDDEGGGVESGEEEAVQEKGVADAAEDAAGELHQRLNIAAEKQHTGSTLTQPAPAAPTAGNVIIRDYDPKKARGGPVSKTAAASMEKYIISPLTNERIPADKLHEHVRYNTVDPQFKEQRDREQMDRQDEDLVMAPGAEISRNIAKLAERRTDIFGIGEKGAEQTIIGKKLGEEERQMPRSDPKTIWDGQLSTIDATTRAAQQSVSLEQQISEIQRQHGYLPNPAAERMVPSLPPPTSAHGLPFGGGPPSTAPPMAPPQRPPPLPAGAIASNVQKILPVPQQQPPMPQQQQQQQQMRPPPQMPPQFMPPPGGRPPMAPPPQQHLGMPPPLPHGVMNAMPPHMQPGLPGMPPPGLMRPPHGAFMPPPPPSGATIGAPSDEPPAKRSREETLEPEERWLQKVQGQITVQVSTPQNDEWSLKGNTIQIQLDISSSATALKSLIQEQTNVPAGKQKLVYEVNAPLGASCRGLFMKDSQTLAYYNFMPNASVQLQLKERGGRKK